MGRKQKPKDRSHIKHEGFKDLNITAIEQHRLQGKTLKTPFSVLGDKVSFSSWRDDGLNEFLWAAILRATFSQAETLCFFRSIIASARALDPKYRDTFISHSALSALSDEDFDTIMEPILINTTAKDALSALLYLETPPDISHWRRHICPPPPHRLAT